MTYRIEFSGFFGGDDKDLDGNYTSDPYAGYGPWDYLPDFDEQEFETVEQARDFIALHYKGADTLGVEAEFTVVPEHLASSR